MSTHRGLLVVVVAVIVALAPVSAHHSSATLYLFDREIVVAGVVTEFRFINPHMRLYMNVTAADGTIEKWMAEGGTPVVLMRRGWSGDLLKPGDRVKVRGNPGRDGAKIMLWLSATLPNGKEMYAEDVDFGAVDRRRQRTR